MRAKVLITGGGTGGHVYPGLSIIRCLTGDQSHSGNGAAQSENLRPWSDPLLYPNEPSCVPAGQERADYDIAYVGNAHGLERTLVPRAGIRCFFFPMAPPNSIRGLLLLTAATLRSAVVILRMRPHVTFATGGYVCAPASLASWLLRVPLVMFLPDVVPGKAVSWLAPLARSIAVSSDASRRYLPLGKVEVTGYPVRPSFREIDRNQARARFGLSDHARVLVVFGGSQGSRNINEALAAALPELLEQFSVLHVCGPERFAEAIRAADRLPRVLRKQYQLFSYLHDQDMAAATAAADLAVCRSGASVLGELPALGIPAILVPLPNVGVHQQGNAQYLAEHGAALILADVDLGHKLSGVITSLLNDSSTLARMSASSRALDRPDAAANIARLVKDQAR